MDFHCRESRDRQSENNHSSGADKLMRNLIQCYRKPTKKGSDPECSALDGSDVRDAIKPASRLVQIARAALPFIA